MGRKLLARTKLADMIRDSGKPMYEIALMAKLRSWQLGMYANGKKVPSFRHVQRICAALACNPEDILEEP